MKRSAGVYHPHQRSIVNIHSPEKLHMNPITEPPTPGSAQGWQIPSRTLLDTKKIIALLSKVSFNFLLILGCEWGLYKKRERGRKNEKQYK